MTPQEHANLTAPVLSTPITSQEHAQPNAPPFLNTTATTPPVYACNIAQLSPLATQS